MGNEELIASLEKEKIFSEWKKDNPESYLVHIFIMDEKEFPPKNYSVGYYNPDDTITTFEINEGQVTLAASEEIFKADDSKVEELDLKKASLEFTQIQTISDDFQKAHYQKEIPTKYIYILQNIDIGSIWNITIVTAAFNTLNIKIDAITGEVKEHKLTSLMQMGEFIK